MSVGLYGQYGGRYVPETLIPALDELAMAWDQVHERSEGTVRGRNAVLLRNGEEVARLLDLPWQQDDPDHWERAASSPGRVVLAGKLAADNVAEAIRHVRPWAVDASSRLEVEPGIKDPDKVRAYVEAARG